MNLDDAVRRRIAVHEAGHITVMWHHWGITPHIVRIGRMHDGSWEGGVAPWPGLCISAHKRRLIAVAGAVAESVWDGAADAGEVNMVEGMSPEDWDYFGSMDDPRNQRALFPAVRTCFKLLDYGGPLWPKLMQEAERLIAKPQIIGES
jgi:hypothetical protein